MYVCMYVCMIYAYRDRISAEVEGRPLPTELPIVKQSSGITLHKYILRACILYTYIHVLHMSGGGAHVAQGSDPLPGESEAAYVARQKQLQNEVIHTCIHTYIRT